MKYFKRHNREISQLAEEIDETILAIVEGEDPEIIVRLPGTMLESDDLYLQVTYKALAVYRYQAYNEV